MSARAQPAAAQLQADIGQPDPGVAFGLALDLLVDALCSHQQAAQACGVVPLRCLGDQRASFVPDWWASLAEGAIERNALTILLGDVGQQAQLARQGPED